MSTRTNVMLAHVPALVLMLVLVLCMCVQGSAGMVGVDVSAPTSTETFACLAEPSSFNASFATIRIWHSYGAPDTGALTSIPAARAAGIRHVYGYIFPCAIARCSLSASEQMSQAMAFVEEHNVPVDGFFIDVEGVGKYWSDEPATNRAFLEDMVSTALDKGWNPGVYVSVRSFDGILGSEYSGLKRCPLWWSAYGPPSFEGFAPYGGWTAPSVRQYDDGGPWKCHTEYDRNFMEAPPNMRA